MAPESIPILRQDQNTIAAIESNDLASFRPTPIPPTSAAFYDRITNTPMTAEQYAAIVRAPGYRDDLGLRVCYEGREIVSGGICWYDAVAFSGELEPIGTSAEHRRKGLALAVISRLLANLGNLGAKDAYVRTQKENESAIRLYEKLGFQIADEDVGWVRNLV